MPWLMFAVAFGAVVFAFNTFSIGLAAVCLLLALGLSIAGALSLASNRISNSAQSPAQMLDAKALAGIRKRAEESKSAPQTDAPPSGENPESAADDGNGDAAPRPGG